MDMTGRIVLVTGSGWGIGREIANHFGRHGASVIVNARTVSDVEDTVTEINEAGGSAVGLPADISDPGQVEAMFRQAKQALGPVEILVNNAGIPGPAAFAQNVTADEFLSVLKINLWGTFLCSKFALPSMIEKGWGRIITMTGAGAARPYRGSLPYASSKAGIEGLTRNLAEEIGPFGVTCNCIAPGRVDTRGFALSRYPRSPETSSVQPDLAARLAIWLASPDASSVNGQTISAPEWAQENV